MFKRCYYCKKKAVKYAICNDWGNIPLCDNKECWDKFNAENTSQFFIEEINKKKDGCRRCDICPIKKYCDKKECSWNGSTITTNKTEGGNKC